MSTKESDNNLPEVYKSWSLVTKSTFSLSKITQWLSKTIQNIISKKKDETKKDEPRIDEDFSEWEKSFAEEIATQKEICQKYNATHIEKIGKSTLYYIRTAKGESIVSLNTIILWSVEKIEIPTYYYLEEGWYNGKKHLIIKTTNKQKKSWIDIYKGEIITLTNIDYGYIDYNSIYDIPHEEWYYRAIHIDVGGKHSAEIIDKNWKRQSGTYHEIENAWNLIIAKKKIDSSEHLPYRFIFLVKNTKGFFCEMSEPAWDKEKIWENSIIMRYYKDNVCRRYNSDGTVKLKRTGYLNNAYGKEYQICVIGKNDDRKTYKIIFQGEILPIENISENRYRDYINLHDKYDYKTYATKNKDLFIVQEGKIKKIVDGELQEPIEWEDFILIHEWKYRFYGKKNCDSLHESWSLTDRENNLILWEFTVYKDKYIIESKWSNWPEKPRMHYLVDNSLDPISEEFTSLEYTPKIGAFIWTNNNEKVIVTIDGVNATEYHKHFVIRDIYIKKWVILAGKRGRNDCFLNNYEKEPQYLYSTNFDLLAWPVTNIEINGYTATITRDDWSIYDIFLDGTPVAK